MLKAVPAVSEMSSGNETGRWQGQATNAKTPASQLLVLCHCTAIDLTSFNNLHAHVDGQE